MFDIDPVDLENIKFGCILLAPLALISVVSAAYAYVRGGIGVLGRLAGFNVGPLTPGTTTRQSTGETASDFRFYPKVAITPDVNGTYTVTWSWANKFDGAPVASSGPIPITNSFPGFLGGQPQTVQLLDNRPENNRAGAIAIGDIDFIDLNKQDGLWHSFESDLTIKVTSPSGVSVTLTGKLGPENFKSTGVLSAQFAGWNLVKI